jgi:choline dehydrogenase-like flavoprotein
MSEAKSTDVLIVGSGVVGGLIAEKLLERGVGFITMLEAGPDVKMRDRRTWLDVVMAGEEKLPYKHLTDTKEDYEATGVQPWQIEWGGRLLARGGSTLHWGGWCPRLKPEDFQLKSLIGKGGLDWPFTYDELEPYYEQAERYLQVAGDSSDQVPPRKSPYPFEAAPYTMTDGAVIEALKNLGISYMHIPIARNAKPINGMPQCVTTGTCAYCPIGARFTGDQPLDRLQQPKSSFFQLYLGSPVRRILTSGNRAVGVEYLDTSRGDLRVIEAETIILCAGALEIPKLLLASANQDWPQGIGNEYDRVGRYLIANPFFYVRGQKTTNPNKCQEELFFTTLGSRYWDTPQCQPEGKFFLNKAKIPYLDLADLMNKRSSPEQIEAATTGDQSFELQGTMQTFCYYENRVLPAKGYTRFGLPRTLIDTPVSAYSQKQAQTYLNQMKQILQTMGYTPTQAGVYPQRGDHAMCTSRMSKSPAEGVVDPDLKVHGMDNLYIVSNAVFPSGAAANPTLTLAALAFRFVEHFPGKQ